MPAVVREHVERGTFEGSLDIQRQLIAGYKEDIRKYAEGMDLGRILNAFNQIPPQLARRTRGGFFRPHGLGADPSGSQSRQRAGKAPRTLISGEKYSDISHGIKLAGGNVGDSGNIYTFPYFCAFLLKRYLKGLSAGKPEANGT